MMNVTRLAFLAPLAYAARTLHRTQSSHTPSNPVGSGGSPLPAWMADAVHEFRLPFCHATVRAKRLVAVKITGRPAEFITAPCAYLCDAIRPAGIGSPDLCGNTTRHRAIFLRALACVRYVIAAKLALIGLSGAPTIGELTLARTEGLWFFRPTAIQRVKGLSAMFTIARLVTSHTYIIPHNERYCEIAARRLSQEVMAI